MKHNFLLILFLFCKRIHANLITYEQVRGTPYKVGYDHRAITINGVRTMLISGAIHYPRSTPAMWPYIMKMAKDHGLNTIQTYAFWNLHEPKQGILDFSGRANLSQFLREAANAGLFVNLRIGPYIGAEWNYGGLPAWLNQQPNIAFRSSNQLWEELMKKFILTIIDYVTPYLAKNGGPIILAQIENEYNGNDMTYVHWCGSLVTNELSSTEIPWIMCNGHAANSTIETCNSCNCLDDGWMTDHRRTYPNQPLIFTENEGWFQQWGESYTMRTPSDIAYSVASWFAAGGAYHAYYMWFGGNNYGRTAGSAITTSYADDVCLHSDGTPNEPKYTHLRRLQHLIAQRAQDLIGYDPIRIELPYWNGKQWVNGTEQVVYSYSVSIHFIINHSSKQVNVLFHNQNISINGRTVFIYDDQLTLLYDSNDYHDIPSNNTELIPIVTGPFQWQIWSESSKSIDMPIVSSSRPLEQLNLTQDETIYLWYRRNITLKRAATNVRVQVQTRLTNALLFYFAGQFLGEFNTHHHAMGNISVNMTFDLSQFQPDREYQFEILSISLGLCNHEGPGIYEYKGIVGNVWFDDDLLIDHWQHQIGLIGEYLQIYTKENASKVHWNPQWTQGINQTITWFQTKFDLDQLINNDTNTNPILLDAQGLNRGHAFINGNDLGLYWLIQGQCPSTPACCCRQTQTDCSKPTQRYYHIPSDWLMSKDNLLTVFDDLGAPAPGSVAIVQRIVYFTNK